MTVRGTKVPAPKIPAELAQRLIDASARELLRAVQLLPGVTDPTEAAKAAIDAVTD